MAEEKQEQEEQKEEQEQKEERVFTQEELNSILAKEKGREAAKILKEMGVEDVAKGKEAISQLAEWQKEKLTKEELLSKEAGEYKEKLTAAEQRAINSEIKLQALRLGVSDDYLDDVIKLLPEGDGTIEERLKAFLDKRPVYLKKSKTAIGGPTGEPSGKTPTDDAKARLRASMGLKP